MEGDEAAPLTGWERKVDARLRALVESPEADPGRRVTVFVRHAGPPDRLPSLGLTLGTRAGEVSSGSLAVADVPRVAAAPEVAFVEMTRELSPDED